MLQVWLLFKALEASLGATCMAYHIAGINNQSEPIQHIMLFCGTFFGFTLIAVFSGIAICLGATPPPLMEGIVNLCGSAFYFVSSIVSMHFAENDFHLMYLSDYEEPTHPYFRFCKSQSIAALAAGSLHLLHSILAFDAVFIRSQHHATDSVTSGFMSSESEGSSKVGISKPIRLYFLGRPIEQKLRRLPWFDKLCHRRSADLSIMALKDKTHEERRASSFISQTIFATKSPVTGSTPLNKSRRESRKNSQSSGSVPFDIEKQSLPPNSNVEPRSQRAELSDRSLEPSAQKIDPTELKKTSFQDVERPDQKSLPAIPDVTPPIRSVKPSKQDATPSDKDQETGALDVRPSNLDDRSSSQDVKSSNQDERLSSQEAKSSDQDSERVARPLKRNVAKRSRSQGRSISIQTLTSDSDDSNDAPNIQDKKAAKSKPKDPPQNKDDK